MPIMAIGSGSGHGLEYPSTTGEPLCEGPLPLDSSEIEAMCLTFYDGPDSCPVGIPDTELRRYDKEQTITAYDRSP